MKDSKKYTTIGKAIISDIEKFTQWLKTDEGMNYVEWNWSEQRSKMLGVKWDENCIGFSSLQGVVPFLQLSDNSIYNGDKWNRINDLVECQEYLLSVNQKFNVVYLDPQNRFASIYYGDFEYMIPCKFLDLEMFVDYDMLTVAEAKRISGTVTEMSLLPADRNNVSINSAKSKIEEAKSAIQSAIGELTRVEDEKREELEKLKAELEKKYQERLSEIQAKRDEVEKMKEDLEKQLYILESEIYAIRCYTGEVVNFTCLMKGNSAPVDTPFVVNQKIRFLDEELAKAVAIYDFDGDKKCISTFEKILQNREDIRGLFAPQEKCIAFVKVSKTGNTWGSHELFANALQKYEKYHGKTIGILIQNGENLYIGWTDEEKISLQSENAFFNPGTKTEIHEDDDHLVETSSTSEMVSRYFIFSILQGLLDHGNIVQLPEKVSITSPNKYIVYSLADGWIGDNRFGTFKDMVEKTKRVEMKQFDTLLTIMRITRDDVGCFDRYGRSIYDAYNNDRGRGEKNRTYDAHVSDATIYPLNLIDKTDYYSSMVLKYPAKIKMTEVSDGKYTRVNREYVDLQGPPVLDEGRTYEVLNNKYSFYDVKNASDMKAVATLHYSDNYESSYQDKKDEDGCIYCIRKELYSVDYRKTEYQYFVSVEKEENWLTGKRARCNFEIYPDEVLNLTFFNSVWIKYVMMNKELGHLVIGGQKVDFAHFSKYLNIALEYLKKREQDEYEMIEEATGVTPWNEWQVDLSEWKIKNNIHALTPTRAKKFVRDHDREMKGE